jgi:xanthine dehydrogenase accessory factor
VTLALTGRLVELLDAGRPFYLATVVAVHGTSDYRLGEKLIVHANGETEGSLGTPALDDAVRQAVLAQLGTESVAMLRFDASGAPLPPRRGLRDREREPSAVEVSAEPMLPPPHLIIVGAGHIAVPLARLAKVLDFRVTVMDDRARFASRDRFPDADEVLVEDFQLAIGRQAITPWTYLVLVTRGHEHDEATLQHVVGSPAPYIGMIGSRRRVLVVFQRLAERGVPQHFIDRIYAPVGLDIGARTPEEIALAILAEIVTTRRHGNAISSSLRMKGRVQSL